MVYIDDILVFTSTFEEHVRILREVFKRLASANLKISLNKCDFARTDLIYLGFIINSKGISANQEKVRAVLDLPEPKDLKDLQTIIGKLTYYSRFIPDFAKKARPLNMLRRKNAHFAWKQEQKDAFVELKSLLCTAPILKHPNFELEFILATDASGYGIGAVLSQITDGEEHPIAYASRTLLESECRYAVIEREALGVYWGINHFDEYLDGPKHFTVYTDHKPLCSLMTKEQVNKRCMNYATRLSGYNFTILYRKGSSNANADVLSRYPVISLPGKPPPTLVELIEILAIQEHHDIANDDIPAVFDNIVLLQNRNPLFRALRIYLEDGTLPPDLSEYETDVKSSAHLYCLGHKGELCRLTKEQTNVVCVPLELRGLVIYDAHDVKSVAHCGREKTFYRILAEYWWPTMYRDIDNYVRRCTECQKYKRAKKIIQPMGTRPSPSRVWERLHMDVWSPGGESVRGNVCVLAVLDTVSKYLVAEPLSNHNADTVAETLVKRIICTYGPPEEIYSDGAPEFRSQLLAELTKTFGITRRITTPYRPQANGIIERVFATIRPMLSAISDKFHHRWDEYLPYVIYAYNTSYHRSIRNTPFFLFYGRDPSLGTKGLEQINGVDQTTSLSRRHKMMELARTVALQHIKSENQKRKAYYDKNSRPETFGIDDIVMLKSIRPPGLSASKLYPWYVGPYRVIRIVGDRILSVIPVGYPSAKAKQIHSDRARLSCGDCTPNPNMQELLSPFADPSFIDPNLEMEAPE